MSTELVPLSGRVLLVEDDLVNQMIIKKLLEWIGVTVSTASTGQQALTMLNSPQAYFDAVFMDVGLPDISGIEVTYQLRQSESLLKNVPIIALTSHVTSKDKEACFAKGMNSFISKPTTLEILYLELTKVLPSKNNEA